MNSIEDLLLGEPTFVPERAVKSILGADLRRVLPKGAASGCDLKGLTKAVRTHAPHRLNALRDWCAEQWALIGEYNGKTVRLMVERKQMYLNDFRMDPERAFWNARTDVKNWQWKYWDHVYMELFFGVDRSTSPANKA